MKSTRVMIKTVEDILNPKQNSLPRWYAELGTAGCVGDTLACTAASQGRARQWCDHPWGMVAF